MLSNFPWSTLPEFEVLCSKLLECDTFFQLFNSNKKKSDCLKWKSFKAISIKYEQEFLNIFYGY